MAQTMLLKLTSEHYTGVEHVSKWGLDIYVEVLCAAFLEKAKMKTKKAMEGFLIEV